MKRIKFNLIIINLFIIFIFNNSLKAESNFYIIAKVDNEIITNVDISQEANYLIALNNDLKKIDKRFIINMAKNSLIREKVKKNELKKNSKHLSVKNDVLKIFIQNLYEGLNIENENKFKNYLSSYNLDLSTVEDKIKTEILWNQLIYIKFVNQININHEKLKKKSYSKQRC